MASKTQISKKKLKSCKKNYDIFKILPISCKISARKPRVSDYGSSETTQIQTHLIYNSSIPPTMFFGIFVVGNSWKPSSESLACRRYSLSSNINFSEIELNCHLTRLPLFVSSFRVQKSKTSFHVSDGRWLNLGKIIKFIKKISNY